MRQFGPIFLWRAHELTSNLVPKVWLTSNVIAINFCFKLFSSDMCDTGNVPFKKIISTESFKIEKKSQIYER